MAGLLVYTRTNVWRVVLYRISCILSHYRCWVCRYSKPSSSGFDVYLLHWCVSL